MQKYRQKTMTSEKWLRARRIVIDNRLGELPVAKFVEEKVTRTGDGEEYFKDDGYIEVPATMNMMEETIQILDPETGEPTGHEISYAEIQNIMASAYIHFAMKRDGLKDDDSESAEDLFEDLNGE